ncbi:pre-toxin TG domain-containing protein [Parageobacillus toebii]|uniref:pre-toxin TG domain-containing protein n=1 Tax=Parageobacillus toebii TaxID=153151 RepID=UPI002E1E9743|nr:ribonuclease domain-containing protein [Parageobacillus toebii]MED4970508.1 pre-toxin TG domain-containing protein [Parageobacillus toebii]
MTVIRINPEELETVANHVPDAEAACQRAQTSLSWELPSLVMEIPGIGSDTIHELKDELVHWFRRYEEKLNEAEELLYRTAAAMRQADQTLAGNMKEFGLELLGWYDVQRLFGEYAPVTGERISGWDRLLAGGMLLASFVPPVKGVAIAGKAGIKGAKAAGTATDVSKLVSQMKHVLRYDKVVPVFQAVCHQVVKAPITKTIRLFKKQWDDLLSSVSSVQWKPAFAGVGPVSREWIQDTAEEAASSVRFSMSQAGGEVGKGTGGATYKGKDKNIPWLTPRGLPKEEEKALLKTLKHIDNGTKPKGKLSKKWGTKFSNREGYLPKGNYVEYRVEPPPGTNNAGTRRVVRNVDTGEMYYTWTHYGDTGAPAFVRIR